MDLYEALKSGMAAEDITKGFNKELEEAVKKLEEERLRAEEERKTKSEAALNAARHKAAAEVIEYLRTLFEAEGIEITDIFPANGEALTDLFCHLLEESEKDYRSKLDLARVIKAFAAENETDQKKDSTREKRTSAGTYDSGDRNDDTILSNFLSNLF